MTQHPIDSLARTVSESLHLARYPLGTFRFINGVAVGAVVTDEFSERKGGSSVPNLEARLGQLRRVLRNDTDALV
jgi:hypothetical protein